MSEAFEERGILQWTLMFFNLAAMEPRLQTGYKMQTRYKMQTDTKTISVKNTVNFRFLTRDNVTELPFRDQPKQLVLFGLIC